MNKLIFRKLSLDILTFFLLSSLAITSIVWVIQGVNLLDIVTEKGHSINVYLFYSFLSIPKIFSKILIITFFITLFVILSRYEENNEILVFWTNGIKKISFINFIAKLSIIFVLIQLTLNLLVVPYTQNLAQSFLKNSSMEFFPKLIEEKKFSNVMQNLTIFVEEHSENGNLKGIYIKEKLNNEGDKIIIASKGKIIQNNGKFSFKLLDGKITNINNNEIFNLGFKETVYELSALNNKIRKSTKINETNSSILFYCLKEYLHIRKNENLRCGESGFLVKNIYEEIFKRTINPIYLIFISLISSLIILKSKVNFLQNYYKFFLFFIGFITILFAELSYKFILLSNKVEITLLLSPILSILFFYLYILVKTKFKLSYL